MIPNDNENSGEPLLNIDDADKYQDFYKRLAQTKLRKVTDWRQKHNGDWFAALKAKDLRPNDMNFLISIFAGSLLFIILASVLLGLEDELSGAITVWPLLYVFICILIGSASIYQSRKFTLTELLIWVLVNVVYFVIGLIFFLV